VDGRPLIALVDIDGTLLHGRPVAHGLALVMAVNDVFGVPLTEADLLAADPGGRTDLRIAELMLHDAGVPAERARDGLADWCRAAVVRYRELADHHPSPRRAPDAPAALTAICEAGIRTVLVTGNIQDIARDKMDRAGLAGFFPHGQGGFGDDASERAEVVRVALRRAGTAPDRAVVVGDTPRDIEAARAAGCGVVAVTTGRFGARALQAADAVAANLTAVAAHLINGGRA